MLGKPPFGSPGFLLVRTTLIQPMFEPVTHTLDDAENGYIAATDWTASHPVCCRDTFAARSVETLPGSNPTSTAGNRPSIGRTA